MSLWPLFLISGAAVGYEIALTRYFAVAKWSEYGYWVISIVMVGFALSGVTVALMQERLVRLGPWLLQALPVLLILTASFGYWAVTANPFNPLQLQNAATYQPQLANIALYYAVLLPFFFLTGLYISLCFVLNADRVNLVYGYDLTGAGAGAGAAGAVARAGPGGGAAWARATTSWAIRSARPSRRMKCSSVATRTATRATAP
ncbi:MAG: hypothetical protein NVS2B11_16170 [Acetobacteraceae bacterium]